MPRKTILVVEDNPTDAFLIERAFAHANAGRNLCFVQDANAALDYLRGVGAYADRLQHPLPSLMLLDLKLPGKSGFEVLSWLRAQDGLKRLPVVVLTSSGELQDINRAFDIGANSYVIKLADPHAFVKLARNLEHYWTALNKQPDLDPAGTEAA